MTQEKQNLTSIWYWKPSVVNNCLKPCKMLLVMDDNHVAKWLFNLTELGLEDINTYEEIIKLFPQNYEYNCTR